MKYKGLAEILFKDIDKTVEFYEKKYPDRNLPEGACVTRLGPSPTGFIHLGNLYGAFVDERVAHLSEGVFYLRIEDTDDKRYVEGATKKLIEMLDFFGVRFDEGKLASSEKGEYSPYVQSERGEIYKCIVKEMVEKGFAYPCFITEEESQKIREEQEKNKVTPGIYGEYALDRDLDIDEVSKRIDEGRPYVIRLKSDGKAPDMSNHESQSSGVDRIHVQDAIRGNISMPKNFQDIVLLKQNGMPTYHLAHVCDDHFMRTTHVIRGEEWLSTLPIHIELFEKLGWKPPVYCHTAQLMKIDESGSKRKLSKRKDPELSLDYYNEQGYHPDAVREYLMTILNSDFEEWRKENPDESIETFDFKLSKMSKSGALFDIMKLRDISKDVMFRKSPDEIYSFLKKWAETSEESYEYMFNDAEYLKKIIDIGRVDKKPRKDLVYAKQIVEQISYFFDELFEIRDKIPSEVSIEDEREIIKRYLASYNHDDDKSEWFSKIRDIAEELGYAKKPKDYKKNPEEFKGHVGHVSSVIRIALTGKAISPDIWEIQQIMGKEKTEKRLRAFLEECGN